ncbi:phosphohydrolase [Tepiditoga spiralis]|uniref:Phosphohydrolase n=1 Tax=Tepiditoga spiralis TaxID=2108365 RepID=A0A7G1G4S1_9BACT|nr:HD domain-containing phosphohydrolase [Tepiditoga spiralis]BBE31381.1 phosphohydrolase [Tepiditoga spiralis]
MTIFEKIRIIYPKIIGIKINNKIIGIQSKNFEKLTINNKNLILFIENNTSLSDFEKKSLKVMLKNSDLNDIRNIKIDISKFFNIIKILNKQYKLENLLKKIEESLCNLLGSEGSSILLYNKEKKVLNFFITSGGASGKIETIDVPIDNSVAGYIFKNEKTFVANNTEELPFHFKKTDKKSGFTTKNIIGTPIIFHDEIIGVLESVNKENGFTEEDKNIIEVFSKIISNKLLNSRLYKEISDTTKSIILSFATAIDLRDNYTHLHSQNVTGYGVAIAKEMGHSDDFIESIEIAGLVHDIGKIGIPDEILNKKGKLTSQEFEIIKSHTIMGADILSEVEFINDKILCGPLEHHEKLDGSGYPYGKKEEELSEIGKILAIADIYDALTTKRSYKEPWPVEKAINLLRENQETKYYKKAIDALERYLQKKSA